MKLRACLISLLLAASALAMWCRAPLHRPFEGDEIFSLRRFSTLPYDQNYEAVKQWKPFELGRSIHGIAKCFLNGYDNTFLLGYSEAAFRVPSIVAGLVTCLVLFWLCRAESGSTFYSLTLAALLLSAPYLYHYGQTARGYAANLALVALQIAIVRNATPENRLRTYSTLAALSLLMCMNMLTAAVMWLCPMFVALLFWGKTASGNRLALRRDRLYWCGASVCAAVPCAVFGMCHLQDLVIAQGKWGMQWRSAAELHSMTRDLWIYLVPNSWIPAAILGAAGIAVGWVRNKWLAKTIVLSLIVTAAYVLVGHKIPYFRTFGQFLLFIPLGGAWLWEALASRPPLPGRAFGLVARGALAAAFGIPAVLDICTDYRTPLAPDYTDVALCIDHKIKDQNQGDQAAFVLAPFDMGEQIRYYLPADLGYVSIDSPKAASFSLYLPCAAEESGTGFLTQTLSQAAKGQGLWPTPAKWPIESSRPLGDLRQLSYRMMRTAGFPVDAETPCIASWSCSDPYFDLRAYLANVGRNFCEGTVLNFNLDDYLPEKTVTFFIQDAPQAAAVSRILEDLNARTQGHIWTIVPAPAAQ